MPNNRKQRFMLVISGIKLTFVDNFRQTADYLTHSERNEDVRGSREAWLKINIIKCVQILPNNN